ncbi:hypothetical protein QAD02_011133 [Eretmocerus hayati]|uniref:Uncharacterized protein n=1 Tax=Eretmocerus hayati TaxID=131215 RepID=A0ACC2NW85_9HYME|nr:hypothetical protein QAD02_011133 [Eretmocerus hayati]
MAGGDEVESQRNHEKEIQKTDSHLDPFNVVHSSTDKQWLSILRYFLLLWMMIATFAYSTSMAQNNDGSQNEKKISMPSHKDWDSTFISDLASGYLAHSWPWHIVAGCVVLSGIISILYLMLLKWCTKFVIYSAIPVFLISLFVALVKCLMEDDTNGENVRMWSFAWYYMFMFFFCLFILKSNRKEIPLACEVIRESINFFRGWLSTDDTTWNLHVLVLEYRKKFIPRNTVTRAAKIVARYHLGTAALGSFLMALNELIGAIMKILTKGKTCDFSNFIERYFCPLFRVAFAGLEELTRIIGNNTYMICALYGKNFCQSASHVYSILNRNNKEIVFTVDQVTSAVFHAGTGFVVGTSVAVTYGICRMNGIPQKEILHASIMAVVSSAILARAVLNLLSTSVEAFILCALEDLYLHNGSTEKPFFMNAELTNLLLEAQTRAQENSERK